MTDQKYFFHCLHCGLQLALVAENFPITCRCGNVVQIGKALTEPFLPRETRPTGRKKNVRLSGPGTELTALFAEINVTEKPDCNCKAVAAEMDYAGVAVCRERRDYFLGKLNENAKLYSWWEKLAAGKAAWSAGAPLTLGGLFDEALRRAEVIEQPLP